MATLISHGPAPDGYDAVIGLGGGRRLVAHWPARPPSVSAAIDDIEAALRVAGPPPVRITAEDGGTVPPDPDDPRSPLVRSITLTAAQRTAVTNALGVLETYADRIADIWRTLPDSQRQALLQSSPLLARLLALGEVLRGY
jgi:hypothetical protein